LFSKYHVHHDFGNGRTNEAGQYSMTEACKNINEKKLNTKIQKKTDELEKKMVQACNL